MFNINNHIPGYFGGSKAMFQSSKVSVPKNFVSKGVLGFIMIIPWQMIKCLGYERQQNTLLV